MSDFTAFMRADRKTAEEIEFVVSEAFTDEEGNAVPWRLKPVSADVDKQIRSSCQRRIPIPGARGQFRQETDTEAYIAKITAACVVYPNLNNVELQNFYGAMSAEELLTKMLLGGEYNRLYMKVEELLGYGETMDELIDDAKN